MADKQPPYASLDPMRVLFLIPQNPPPTLQKPEMWSLDFIDFIAACLTKDPIQRPNAKQLLQHTFILKYADREKDIKASILAKFNDELSRVEDVPPSTDSTSSLVESLASSQSEDPPHLSVIIPNENKHPVEDTCTPTKIDIKAVEDQIIQTEQLLSKYVSYAEQAFLAEDLTGMVSLAKIGKVLKKVSER
jgi:serine/threonine protein kinase